MVSGSAFACRNVYDLPTGNFSQHAYANAVDVGASELSDGRMLTVLHGWGPTDRDIEEARLKSKAVASAKHPLERTNGLLPKLMDAPLRILARNCHAAVGAQNNIM
jgi:hypothetical protein